MFGTLLLLSTMLLRELGSLTPHTRGQRHCRAAMAAGSVAILLTGIYPEHLEREGDGNLDVAYTAAFALHALGLTAACTLTVAVPFAWVCVSRYRLGGPSGARRLLAVRAGHVALATITSVAFALVRAHADVTDYCEPLSGSGKACAAWPTLTAPDCAAIQRPTRYRCGYVNSTLSADAQRLLPAAYVAMHGASCRKDSCTLYANARSIAVEFASLFFICTCARWAFCPITTPSAPAGAAARLSLPLPRFAPVCSLRFHLPPLSTLCSHAHGCRCTQSIASPLEALQVCPQSPPKALRRTAQSRARPSRVRGRLHTTGAA
jgi:hypothetical protein